MRHISRLGRTLREMIEELRIKKHIIEAHKSIPMLQLSPEKIEEGKHIIKRMKIKYPLQRDSRGRLLKPERIF